MINSKCHVTFSWLCRIGWFEDEWMKIYMIHMKSIAGVDYSSSGQSNICYITWNLEMNRRKKTWLNWKNAVHVALLVEASDAYWVNTIDPFSSKCEHISSNTFYISKHWYLNKIRWNQLEMRMNHTIWNTSEKNGKLNAIWIAHLHNWFPKISFDHLFDAWKYFTRYFKRYLMQLSNQAPF